MDREAEITLAEHTLKLIEARTSDLAPAEYEIPVAAYLDEQRAQRERQRLFRSLPTLAALSCELVKPGDFKAVTLLDVPLLIIRGRDGEVRTYLNACRHRGMKLAEGRGCSPKILCPYHAWTYNDQGRLVGVPRGKEGFPDLDRAERGLVPVATAERHGVIWVQLDETISPMDIDGFLGDFGPELAGWNLDTWHYAGTREHHPIANWKLTLEGYCENYHVSSLHPETVAQVSKSYGAHHTTFGDHQRLGLPNHSFDGLRDVPKEQWAPFADGLISFVYNIFPGTIFALFYDQFQVFQIWPGPTPDTSTTVQSIYTPTELDADQQESLRARFDFFAHVVANEDYAAVQRAQETLRALSTRNANPTLVFGRQEVALHHFHNACNRYAGI